MVLLAAALPAQAATYNVANEAQWNAAMTAAFSTSEDDIVNITASFTLSADLSNIFSSMTINGGNNTINGADSHRAISLAISGANVTINNLTITDNQAPTGVDGGAILYENGSSLTLNNVTIRDSEASYSGSSRNGGGIHCTAANLTIRNSRIHGNSGGDGGGIYISSNCANARIINSSIYDNESTGNGGGIHIWGGTLGNANAPSVTITNSRIYGNTAGTSTTVKDGGGIYVRGTTTKSATLTVSNSSIYSNAAHAEGGGIYAHTAVTFSMSRSAVYNNTSTSNGAGIHAGTGASATIRNSSIFGNSSGHRGGGVYIGGGTSTLEHVTIAGNSTTDAQGTASSETGAGLRAFGGTLHLRASIVHGNTLKGNAENCRVASAVTVGTLSNNMVGAGSDSTCTPNSDPADPLLVGPEVHGQGNFFVPRVGSNAIDSIGNADCLAGVTTDQRGRARPYPPGGNCDKGAIEHEGYVPPQVTTTRTDVSPPPGDDVGSGGGGGSGDGDGDGSVDGFEYSAPPPSTCLTLDGIAAYNLSESTQCQRVDAVGIANPAIQEGDFVDAVDVWSWVMPDTRVCFEASGSAFKFIDTAAMPRTVQDLPACSWNGMTCGAIDGIGMLVLLPGEAPSACAAPVAQATPIPARSLSGCMVRTKYALNMRDAPAGAKIGGVPYDVTLTALERTVGWIKVDYHGEQGWIAAMFVEPIGTCG